MYLSVVTTLYNSEAYLKEFIIRTTKAASEIAGYDFEIVLVNDGSPDGSLDLLLELSEVHQNLRIVDLSRNFGHHKAIMAGLAQAKGQLIYLIDCDLEEDPEWISLFYRELNDRNADVVFGVQQKRKGRFFERFSGQLFYVIFRALTGINIPENVVTARLMKKDYVRNLLRHREREVFLAGIWYITGFKQIPYIVKKHSTSPTTYSLRRKIDIFVNSVTAFTSAPLVGIFYFGLLISLFSFCYLVFIVYQRVTIDSVSVGWTSVVGSIWLIGGLIISFLGVIGIYVSKIFIETKNRPYVVIKRIYGQSKK